MREIEHSVICVSGAPGSGKSRLGRELASWLNTETEYRARHISLGDRLRAISRGRQVLDSVYSSEITEHLANPLHYESPLSDEIVATVVHDLFESCDEHNIDTMILDGYPRYPSQVSDFRSIAYEYSRPMMGMFITYANQETLLTRMLKRGEKHPERILEFGQAVTKLALYEEHYDETLRLITLSNPDMPIIPISTEGEHAYALLEAKDSLTSILEPAV